MEIKTNDSVVSGNIVTNVLSLPDMKFTKFFDVKSPVVDNTPGMYNNAGIDLYMPRMSKEFLLALYEANFPVYSQPGCKLTLKITDYQNIENTVTFESPKELKDFIIETTENKESNILGSFDTLEVAFLYIDSIRNNLPVMYYGDLKYHFNDRMQIPLGIGIEIPQGCYVDLRSKSGNFKNGWAEITGLIDSCYTYGMGVQLVPFNGAIMQSYPEIEVDEKLTQIVLNQFVTIYKFTELTQTEWDENSEIINRREKRIGGFGSTGKF